VIETHQEQSKKNNQDDTDESSEKRGRVYSFGWWLGHDDARRAIVQFNIGGILKRMSEGDLTVCNVSSDLSAETVVADDDFQFIMT